MKQFNDLHRGVNLGGWLSQTEYSRNHFDSFITEKDIKTIASWDLDHVRVPVDYNLFQDENGALYEANFCYIDKCISWCKAAGLSMILDLHKAKGYSFDSEEKEKGLFENEDLINQFISLWETFAERYGGEPVVSFELLNEVVRREDNDGWMKLAERTFHAIRRHAPSTKILIGGYYNNSIVAVKDLAQPFDENVIYTFHCYDPLLFTHQGAYWIPEMDRNFRMKYPVSKIEYDAAMRKAVSSTERFLIGDAALPDGGFSTSYFENLFSEALRISEERNVPLYCGEYGVIDAADRYSTMNWIADINTVFEKHHIGRAIWNYKEKDFGITDEKFDSVRELLNMHL